ncbi:MAG TPA: NAD-dependent deacylase [Thermodesulfobacteriota bacterium]|nr:NAD-dependent deacylase [Thermodesulfobacteriota bacterium]
MKHALIKRAAEDILRVSHVTALTGAGMSAESGIPTFRDKGGFWERYDPEEYAHINTFYTAPEKPWQMFKAFEMQVKARPNAGHLALAEMERLGWLQEIIAQNVDDLHQEAGNSAVIEFHGNFRRAVCLSCGAYYEIKNISLDILPPRCRCSGVLKPDAVFFGEPIPQKAFMQAVEATRSCKVMLVVGTSAIVYPAADMPAIARQAGARVIEINPEPTSLTGWVSDYIILGKAGEILPALVEELKKMAL